MFQITLSGFLSAFVISAAPFGGVAPGSIHEDATTAALRAELDLLHKSLEQVQVENQANKQALTINNQELSELKSQNGDKWLTQERANQIRGVVQDVMSDAQSRASLQTAGATSGYDKGFFIASPDGNFKLMIGGQMQVRYALSRLSSRSLNDWNAPSTGKNIQIERAAYGFELRRMKVEFSGHVIDPSWTFKVTTVYVNQTATQNSAGVGGITPIAGLEETWINKDLGGGLGVRVGQFKSPFNREELVTSRHQLCVERSLVNMLFTTKLTQGIMLTARGENFSAAFSFNDGGNDGNTSTVDGNTNISYGYTQYAMTGRAQYLAFGNWKQFDTLTSARGDAQGLLFGSAFNWQRGGVSNNTTPTNGNGDVAMFSWTADANWMLGGANIFGAIYGNTATSAADGGIPLTNVGSSVFTYGSTLQAGYYVSDDVEMFGRFEWYDTLSNGSNGQAYVAPGAVVPAVGIASIPSNPFFAQHNTIYTTGLNWYLGGKSLKVTTDCGYSVNGVMFTNGFYGQPISNANYRQDSGVNNGGQWVFRCQLQLLF